MYTDSTLRPIYKGQEYTAPDGTRYPHDYPKNEIAGVFPIIERPRPTDKIVTGFEINSRYERVWLTRDKTPEELAAEKGKALRDLEAQQTPRRIREAILGKDAGWLAALDTQIATIREEK